MGTGHLWSERVSPQADELAAQGSTSPRAKTWTLPSDAQNLGRVHRLKLDFLGKNF